ncbi:DNA polymerase III subunit delta' [Candidatus Symbiobacter mobilis CR]|uniref:DNA polymerase III subunit delta n=1 Tax=Candidatus Symbiobacter mobilis CR TaxID=946483 RepID=U5N6M2_9BURK|nr:DNA polymerase III subunit delta' [Candidatus Symbiobacter mobilis CR]
MQRLLAQRGHALLLAGPGGLGQFDLAMALAQSWLCEHSTPDGACGACAACHAMAVHTHPDFFALLSPVKRVELGWPGEEDGGAKPSKDIRIDAMRGAVECAQRTCVRGRGKVVVVYPAERMNVYTANALLKTLEEPAPGVRFVLATEAEHQILPTLRSRCVRHAMAWPAPDEAIDWLCAQGLDRSQAAVALRAAADKPHEAQRFAALAGVWPTLPRAVQLGTVQALQGWTAAQWVDLLQKLCHDLLRTLCGAAPRFFDPADLPRAGTWGSLTSWAQSLARTARTVEHPYHAGLLLDALLLEAREAMRADARPTSR